MFVRKKKNRSGSGSVQVIDKSKAYRVAKTIGSSKNPEQIRRMVELPNDPKVQRVSLKMDAEQQMLYDLLY